jgi:hypothetical protein
VAGGAGEVLASIRHGFGNLANFSGRDSPRIFWPYAILLIVLTGAVITTIFLADFASFAVSGLDRLEARRAESTELIPFGPGPGLERASVALCALAALYCALIAAALARRRHDIDAIEAIGALALPALTVAMALMPPLLSYLSLLLWLGPCLYALIRGGAPERIFGAVMLAAPVLAVIVFAFSIQRSSDVPPIVFTINILSLPCFLLVALRANRFWPIWFVSFNSMALVLDLAHLLNPQLSPWVYLTVGPMFGYPSVVALIIGTRAHRIRLKRDGVDRAWISRFARPA